MVAYLYVCCVTLVTLAHLMSSSQGADFCDIDLEQGEELTYQQQYECLVAELFDPARYNALVRPVREISDVVQVEISVQLSQIIDIISIKQIFKDMPKDEKNQVMKSNVWLQLYWTDYQLNWINNEKYNKITVLRINPELVWRPDVVLFNNADGNYEVSYASNVVIYNTGFVYWIPPAIYKSSCSMDVQYFPFDEQQCDLVFGSWTFMTSQLDFDFYKNVTHLDVSDYLPSGAWDIVQGNAKTVKTPFGENGERKTMVVFELVLRRKTLFYTVNLIIPCVLISFVTLSVFILPADAGEKITLCISILLALVVFLLLISKILPPALKIPLISQYLLFTFIMNILAIVCTVVVINRNYRTPRTHQMPHWVRLLFLNYLPKVLFLKRPDHEERWVDSSKAQPDITNNVNSSVPQGTNISPDADNPEEEYIEAHNPSCRQAQSGMTAETSFTEIPPVIVSPEIYNAAESLKFIHKHLKKDDDYHTVIDDWRYVARVLDRFLLTLFLMVTILGSVSLFMSAPHIFERINQDEILDVLNKAWEQALKPSEK